MTDESLRENVSKTRPHLPGKIDDTANFYSTIASLQDAKIADYAEFRDRHHLESFTYP